MMDDEKRQALENIELIKEFITETNRELSYSGGGWISIIWGIFCIVGFAGQRLFNIFGMLRGLWWLTLSIIGCLITYFFVKNRTHTQSQRRRGYIIKGFYLFWLPLLILAYALALFCVFVPEISYKYIPIFILLVISTGFLIIGFLFNKEILFMAIIGFVGTIITGIFFLDYADIILGLLFGIGLIATGVISNFRWKQDGRTYNN
jgi:hypothetical protein